MKLSKFSEAYLVVAGVLMHRVDVEVVRVLAEVDVHCAARRELLLELLKRSFLRRSSGALCHLFARERASGSLTFRLLLFRRRL